MRRLAAALFVATLVSCGGADSATGPNRLFGAEYNLQSIDGVLLPITYQNLEGAADILISDRLSFRSDGSYSAVRKLTSVGYIGNPTMTLESVGRWTYAPSTGIVSLQNSQGSTFATGFISGNALTLTDLLGPLGPSTYIYLR